MLQRRVVSANFVNTAVGCCVLVSGALVVVDDEVNSAGVEEGVELLRAGLGDRSRDLRGDRVLNDGRHLEGLVLI